MPLGTYQRQQVIFKWFRNCTTCFWVLPTDGIHRQKKFLKVFHKPDGLRKLMQDTEQPREARHEALSLPTELEREFKVETFLPITDTLSVHLKQGLSLYKDLKHRFGFFSGLKTLNSEESKQSCKEFVEIYYKDVSENELEMECLHLTEYLEIVQSSENEEAHSLSGIYHLLKENKIEDRFPNVEIALRIFLSMMVTNCSGERSFSKLKRIKNELRSTMFQEDQFVADVHKM
ncbi:hypothetical protein ILUMI_16634 [Ignelater luminosus]|uniref:HAT C-terminal dimerisation domain-containing protein n=1 Tax=Ignelater luminosus TaxID=2038154 RepID=A0A8K0CLD8_IGNLU|nr:hypothetical protein ILUMI_16634 [Ignelater luminosus]